MKAELIFLPAFAMAILTFAVWLRLYQTRLGEMRRRRIAPQAMATSKQATVLEDTRAADNFRNLFELPVLFYMALVIANLSHQVNALTLVLAWTFVGLRVLHSGIHCTYNKVMHRFTVYVLGGWILWALWSVLAFGLINS